jgi:hypothetical protein
MARSRVGLDELFKGRHFEREIIFLCVRLYLRFKLSFRDLVEMMAERGLSLAHTTILRWVQGFAPEFERRWNRFARLIRRFLARRRDLYQDPRCLDVSLPSRRPGRQDR